MSLLLGASRRLFSSAPSVTSKVCAPSPCVATLRSLPNNRAHAAYYLLGGRHFSRQVFFDISIGGSAAGRVTIGLFGSDVPKVGTRSQTRAMRLFRLMRVRHP
jgi:hypothetical protein